MLHVFVYFGDTGNVANEFEEMCHVGVFGEEESIYLVTYLENVFWSYVFLFKIGNSVVSVVVLLHV